MEEESLRRHGGGIMEGLEASEGIWRYQQISSRHLGGDLEASWGHLRDTWRYLGGILEPSKASGGI